MHFIVAAHIDYFAVLAQVVLAMCILEPMALLHHLVRFSLVVGLLLPSACSKPVAVVYETCFSPQFGYCVEYDMLRSS